MPQDPILIPPVLALIVDAASYRKCRAQDILSDRRIEAQTRFAIMWVASVLHGLSLPAIGKDLGGRHHSTILRGLRVAEKLRRDDDNFRTMAEWLLHRATERVERQEMEKAA